MRTYAILGGGGSFGIHASIYLLDHANPKKVIGIGRNPLRPEPFSLKVDDGDPRYAYHAYHVTHELDLLLRAARQGAPAGHRQFRRAGRRRRVVETFVALL